MNSNVRRRFVRRLGLAAWFLCFTAINAAEAGTFKIATADSVETRAIAVLAKEIYRRLGHDAEVVFLPAERSIREVNDGKLDAELARVTGVTNKFPNLVRVKEPIYTLSVSAIVRSNSNIKVDSWSGIGDRRVGYPRGYQILDIRTRNLNATKAKDPSTIIKMVQAGRMDIGLVLTSDAATLARKFDGISVLEPPIEEFTLYHFVHVKHRRMVPALEKVLIELNDSGRSKAILSGQD